MFIIINYHPVKCKKIEFSRLFAINLRDLYSFFMLRYSSGQPLQIILISSNLLNTRWTNLSNPLLFLYNSIGLKSLFKLKFTTWWTSMSILFSMYTISDWILCKFKMIIKTFNAIQVFFQFIDSALGGVHKLRWQEEGGRWSKKLTFCKLLYHRKCKRRGVGGKKVKSCKRSLWTPP